MSLQTIGGDAAAEEMVFTTKYRAKLSGGNIQEHLNLRELRDMVPVGTPIFEIQISEETKIVSIIPESVALTHEEIVFEETEIREV